MIIVEFSKPNADNTDHEVCAELRVHRDGRHQVAGNLTEELLYNVGIMNGAERLYFADDPYQWARRCAEAFRTPYYVPSIREDETADFV